MTVDRRLFPRCVPPLLLLFLLANCHGTAGSTAPGLSPADSVLSGRVVWGKTPVKKSTLFLIPERSDGHPGRDVIEVMTRSDGNFSLHLPPGRYLLKSAPSTMCPVKGEIVLAPGANVYLLKVHPVSFLSCTPGTIVRR